MVGLFVGFAVVLLLLLLMRFDRVDKDITGNGETNQDVPSLYSWWCWCRNDERECTHRGGGRIWLSDVTRKKSFN